MAPRNQGELIQDLRRDFTVLRAELDALAEQFERADVLPLRERLAVLESRFVELSLMKEEVKRIVVLEDRVAELKRLKEEGEKRHWQFIYIIAGGMTTLLVTVIVQLVLALLKKP